MQIEHNRNKKTRRRQPVGYLQAWLRIWTRDNQEQIQQVAKVGLKPPDCQIGSVMWGPLGHAAAPVRVPGELGGGGEGGESEGEGGSLTALMKKELICDNIIHDRRIILSYHLISLVKHSVMCLVPIHQGNDSKLTL